MDGDGYGGVVQYIECLVFDLNLYIDDVIYWSITSSFMELCSLCLNVILISIDFITTLVIFVIHLCCFLPNPTWYQSCLNLI
jgi:hypothetical protein